METFEMDDFQMRLAALSAEGYHCSQILLLLALERTGRENPDLLRVLGGISRGVAEGSETCGALLGGPACWGFTPERDSRAKGSIPCSVPCSGISRSGSGRRRAFPGKAPGARTSWKPSERRGVPCSSGRCG